MSSPTTDLQLPEGAASNHTPTPWKLVDDREDDVLLILGPRKGCRYNGKEDTWEMCRIDNGVFWDDDGVEQEDRANAALVVAAVNAYEADKAEIAHLRQVMQEAIDLLLERTQGSPARAAAHNARVHLQFALTGDVISPPNADTVRLSELEAEVARLKSALEFFADERNWRSNGPLDANSSNFDGASRARATLEVRHAD